jgi:ABC-type transport system involved in multi-copper enzyme maturation permease subunit
MICMRPIVVIARFVLLEALRGGLPWLGLACVGMSVGLAAFLAQVALTEARELQAAAAAALLRASGAFLMTAHVVASVAREASERGLELALTLPISRSAYYAGKLAGFSCCALLLATTFAAPLLLWTSPAALSLWWASLATEMALVAAMALFFSMALPGIVPAIAATAALYLLGRSLSAIHAIAAGPLAEQESALLGIVDWLSLLIPRLDAATRTEWLLYGLPAPGDQIAAVAGLAIYCAFISAAGLFDFSRRDL